MRLIRIRRKKTIDARLVTEDMKVHYDGRYYPVRHVEVSDERVVILCGERPTFHSYFKLFRAPTAQMQVKV